MKDNFFSPIAGEYARFRPRYPKELFAYLASIAPGRALAWDCATGSGQAAQGLVDLFDRVIATDISDELLSHAMPHERIAYRNARAEQSGIADASIDLITVSQAVHWFHGEAFNDEVRRVLKPGGIIAAWCYTFSRITPGVDAIVRRLHFDIVDPFWLHENRLVEQGYASIDFPFAELEPPAFEMTARFTLERWIGYLGTWSASSKYHKHHGIDPVGLVREELAAAWGDPQQERTVTWPIHMRVGRV